MQSNPRPKDIDRYIRHANAFMMSKTPFGIIDILIKMDEEEFFPCNFMMVDTFKEILALHMKKYPDWGTEKKDHPQVGDYDHYIPPLGLVTTPEA